MRRRRATKSRRNQTLTTQLAQPRPSSSTKPPTKPSPNALARSLVMSAHESSKNFKALMTALAVSQ